MFNVICIFHVIVVFIRLIFWICILCVSVYSMDRTDLELPRYSPVSTKHYMPAEVTEMVFFSGGNQTHVGEHVGENSPKWVNSK